MTNKLKISYVIFVFISLLLLQSIGNTAETEDSDLSYIKTTPFSPSQQETNSPHACSGCHGYHFESYLPAQEEKDQSLAQETGYSHAYRKCYGYRTLFEDYSPAQEEKEWHEKMSKHTVRIFHHLNGSDGKSNILIARIRITGPVNDSTDETLISSVELENVFTSGFDAPEPYTVKKKSSEATDVLQKITVLEASIKKLKDSEKSLRETLQKSIDESRDSILGPPIRPHNSTQGLLNISALSTHMSDSKFSLENILQSPKSRFFFWVREIFNLLPTDFSKKMEELRCLKSVSSNHLHVSKEKDPEYFELEALRSLQSQTLQYQQLEQIFGENEAALNKIFKIGMDFSSFSTAFYQSEQTLVLHLMTSIKLPKKGDIKDVTKLTLSVDINSYYHICKYCRGTLSYLSNEQSILFKSLQKRLVDLGWENSSLSKIFFFCSSKKQPGGSDVF